MLAIHKYANPGAHPVYNVLGHVGSIACIVLVLFGKVFFGCETADVAVAIAMGLNSFVYFLWLQASGATSPIIPAVFWGALAIIILMTGYPGCVA